MAKSAVHQQLLSTERDVHVVELVSERGLPVFHDRNRHPDNFHEQQMDCGIPLLADLHRIHGL